MQILFALLRVLSKVDKMSDINQMSAANLATCLGPNMLRKEVREAPSRSSGISPILLNAAQQQIKGTPDSKRGSFFGKKVGAGSSQDNLKAPHSKDNLALEKDAKAMLATNALVVNIVGFLIQHFDEIWEVLTEYC